MTDPKHSKTSPKKALSNKVKIASTNQTINRSEKAFYTDPQFESTGKKKKRKAKSSSQNNNIKNGNNSHKRKYNTDNKEHRSAVSEWLLDFGWKRNLPYADVTKPFNLSEESLRAISSRESTASTTGKPSSARSKASDHDNREDAVMRAKLALFETQSILNRLGMATLSYCDAISGQLNLFSPTDQLRLADEVSGYLIDKNFGFYSQAAGAHDEGPSEIVITMPKRREVSIYKEEKKNILLNTN